MSESSKQVNNSGADARRLLRQWLACDESAADASISALGRNAIRAAAQAAERLDRSAASMAWSNGVLHELQVLAEAHALGPPQRKRSWFGFRAPLVAPAPDLNELAEKLERERDIVARATIGVETDLSRFQAAEEGLDAALALLKACLAAVESASRELSPEQPEGAAFLREKVVPRLIARDAAVLTQMAVTHQGVMALQLVLDGQRALAQAIDAARETSISALRTALAARQVLGDVQDMQRQTDALGRTADAACAGSGSGAEIERRLADAVAQARRTIDAAQVSRMT